MARDSVEAGSGRWSWNRIKQAFGAGGTGGAHAASYDLGRAAERVRRYDEAASHYRAALAADPDDAGCYYALAAVLKRLGRLGEALGAYQAAVARKPDDARLRVDFCIALMAAGQLDEARSEVELALALAPDLMEAHFNLGVIQHQSGRLDLAIVSVARALELEPGNAGVHSNLLFILNYSAQHRPEEIYAAHRRFNARQVQPVAAPEPDRNWPRKLRIGYVSADFRSHVVSSSMLPAFARHDRGRFEIYGYHTYPESDEVTSALRGMTDNWLDCADHSDADLAAQIRADRIDILVDLAGHTAHNRLTMFALRPAPLQLTYLGYPNTTGMTAIDARITDAKADPPGEAERLHSERLARLPRSFLCYRPGPDVYEAAPPRSGPVTFGCFNNFQKLSAGFFDAAARILRATPGSRLLLKAQPLGLPAVARRVRERFAAAGVDASRLELLGWERSVEGHLATYRRVDIALDSFPYNGTTTTCEALWMGVPVIAVNGDRHAGRVGASILKTVGLDELLASNVDGYVDLAVRLAGDPQRLATLRAGIRARVEASALRDETGFARELEACYTALWEEKLRSRAPVPSAPELAALWEAEHDAGEGAAFVEAAGRAIGAGNDTAQLQFMVGCTMEDLGRPSDAVSAYQRALERDPRHAKAANNLGCLQEAAGDLPAAARSYDQALAADPELGNARYNRAVVLRQQGRLADAEADLKRALAREPRQANWLEALAEVHLLQWRLDEAEAALRAALAIDPASARGHFGLANTLMMAGRADEAEASFRRATDLQSDFAEAHSNLLLCLHYRKGAQAKLLFDEHRAWAARYTAGLASTAGFPAADRTPGRRLNIGYVSPNLHRHSVASFLEPLLASHDRSQVRVFCYSGAGREDEVTARLKRLADEWRDLRGLSNDAVARLVRDDRIDVLVDLAGHTGGGRLPAFARRAAPVQVSWLGYPDTTGLAQMDYRLTDEVADPAGEADGFHSEKLVRLPGGFLCYQPEAGAPAPGALPMSAGGRVTFGCFNNLAKVTPDMVATWARLLKAVPGSRLMLKAHALGAAGACRALTQGFAAQGIGADRLQLLGPEDSAAGHLGRYREVDIALDTYPYNGTTTTCEALWMGVPVLTLAGPTHVTRVGASLLTRLGLEKALVARSADEYVAKAAALAGDAARLSALRAGLRERMRMSPLMDARAFAHSIEAAYRSAWDTWRGAAATLPAAPTVNGEGMRLHVGGKETKEGWKILNIQPGPGVDFVGTCSDLAQFADGSVSELYASHVLEHLGYKEELPRALEGFHRVLRADGRLMISVPDFAVLCRLFLDPRHTLMERYSVMRMAFGGQMDEHDFHYAGLDYGILSKYLMDAGFSRVERVPPFGLFDDDSQLEYLGESISLNVVAHK
jgi:predicted O-linked N-acetylglucosamine transferase (SPINDLY family)/predicted SAM-dependent methyltransferase